MRKKKFYLSIGTIGLLIAGALAYRSSKVLAVNMLYYTINPSTKCMLFCSDCAVGAFRTTGVTLQSRLSTCIGTYVAKLYATSTCQDKVCLVSP